MRSRSEEVPDDAAVERALRLGLCGLGGRLDPVPETVDGAAAAAALLHDRRLADRVMRFAEAPIGSYVWTKDVDGALWLGRLTGEWRYDGRAGAHAVDLVHVRACDWLSTPVPDAVAPAAVHVAFRRGGRNWQGIRAAGVSEQTETVWRQRRG